LRAGLDDALDTRAMGVLAGATNRVDDRIDVVALPQRVEGREGHADFGPESAQDQLAPPGGAHRGEEIGVLPRVGRRPINRRVVLEQFGELGHCRLSASGCDVDRGMNDRHVEGLRGLHGRDDVLEQQVTVHRSDSGELRRLVVDHEEGGVVRA
jgi:hypothetical protein